MSHILGFCLNCHVMDVGVAIPDIILLANTPSSSSLPLLPERAERSISKTKKRSLFIPLKLYFTIFFPIKKKQNPLVFFTSWDFLSPQNTILNLKKSCFRSSKSMFMDFCTSLRCSSCLGWSWWNRCVLTVRLSQDHKYVVKAEVLKNWPLDEAELTFIQKLRESRRNEMRGTVKNTTPQSLPVTPKVPTMFSKAWRIYS